MKIGEFYSQNAPNLEMINNPNWRQFRFALFNRRFFKVPDSIKNEKDLQKWLVSKKPMDVYYSVSKFLSPHLIGPKGEKISENLFLGSDLVFDIDFEPFCIRNLEKARRETIKLLSFIKEKNFEILYIAFSGAKGFHLVCKDPYKYDFDNPIERENKAKEYRRKLVDEILEKEIKIDPKVTVDTRRILRLPGTINSKTGLECILLDEKQLEKRAIEIIKNSRRVDINASKIRKEMTDQFHWIRKILGLHRKEVRSNSPYFYSSFLSSEVTNTKLHVPIVSFRTRNEIKAVKKLNELQETYNLSDFFLFRGDKLFAIGINALQRNRVEKILKKAESTNTHFFNKYKKAFTRIAPKVDEKMREFEKAPEFIRKVQSSNSQKPVSKTHLNFLNSCQIAAKKYQKQIGGEEFILSHSLIEN